MPKHSNKNRTKSQNESRGTYLMFRIAANSTETLSAGGITGSFAHRNVPGGFGSPGDPVVQSSQH
jgi:hypothetical protein